jgi:hypothetical protein
MRINFRQGIVIAPPGFLQLNGATVNLNVAAPAYVSVALADGPTDYLHTERVSVVSAWTGPFASGVQDYWLYWDLDPLTGLRTFGHTLIAPVDSPVAPSAPAVDQHWFDTTNNVMKVFTGTGRWLKKIRVFAAKLDNGSVLQSVGVANPAYEGSQISTLTAIPTMVGPILYDINGDAIKRLGGYFFTTEDVVVTGAASAGQLKIAAINIEAVATANIPAYSIVHFVDFNKITLATNVTTTNGAYGMIDIGVVIGEVVNVAMEGLITNPLWNWTVAGVNAPLYVSLTGDLTPTPPPNPVVVATVVDINTILLRSAITTVAAPAPSVGVPHHIQLVATAAQTVVNTSPLLTTAKTATTAYIQVYRNGVLQQEGSSKAFTVTGASQITFASGLALNDDIAVFAYA